MSHDWGYYPGDEQVTYVIPEKKKKTIKLFVYGTLKKGHRLNVWLEDQKFVRKAKTLPDYALLTFGWFPGLVEGNKQIEGEICRSSSYPRSCGKQCIQAI